MDCGGPRAARRDARVCVRGRVAEGRAFDRRKVFRPASAPTRGTLNVEDERVIHFPKGLLGFPDHSRYALIQTGEENYFFWLQCVDEPNLAFVVTDPSIFFKDYEVPIKEETQAEIGLADIAYAQVFVICNKV